MPKNEWSIERFMQQSSGFWVSATLHAGVKHDVFTPLAEESLTTTQLAERTGCSARGLGMLLDALTALGLLDKEAVGYRAGSFARTHLVQGQPGYLGDIVLHHHHLMESWAHLDRSVASGAAHQQPSLHKDEEWLTAFLNGMFNLASMRAPQVAQQLDFSAHQRLLDLGGGPGTYAIQFCRVNPDLTATIFDRPVSRPIATATVARFDMQQQIDFHPGDFNSDPLPTGYDLFWMSHILHSNGPEACRALVQRAVDALEPGGLLLIQEFILNNDGCSPVFPTLFALNMLVQTDEGQAYREDELIGMMTAAGLVNVRRVEEEQEGNGIGIVVGEKLA